LINNYKTPVPHLYPVEKVRPTPRNAQQKKQTVVNKVSAYMHIYVLIRKILEKIRGYFMGFLKEGYLYRLATLKSKRCCSTPKWQFTATQGSLPP